MPAITNESLGQPINIYIVTNGTDNNINRNTNYPPLSIIFVPKNESDNTQYKMYLSDAKGRIHDIVNQ